MPGKRGNPNLVKGGASLNPNGRRKGSKNKLTLMQNGLIDQFAGEMNKEFKAVIRTVIREAKGGDMSAARLLLDRAIPARKAVEHYGTQDGNHVVIDIQGLDNPVESFSPVINGNFEEIEDGLQDEQESVQ